MTLAAFYPISAEKPKDATIRLILGGSAESRIEATIGPLPMTLLLPIKGLGAGDHVLSAEVCSGGKTLTKNSQTISLADRLDARITTLKQTIRGWPEGAASTTTDRESARDQLRMLESLAGKTTLESDFPAEHILADLEIQIRAADRSQPFLGKDRSGQAWVTVVSKSGRRAATRVFIPKEAAKGEPLPIVVALHGAGEARTCSSRATVMARSSSVVASEAGCWSLREARAFVGAPVADVVDELAKLYPVDRGRVMLVGHSMGAGQAVAAAMSEPTRYAAVAALGGGGSVRPQPALRDLPFFVGIGSEDFGLKAAKNLADNLERAGAATVIFREYPGIEHLAIVQVALGDVFRFFDERAKPR